MTEDLAAKAIRIKCFEIFESLRYRLLGVIIGVCNNMRGVFFQSQRPLRSDCTHVIYNVFLHVCSDNQRRRCAGVSLGFKVWSGFVVPRIWRCDIGFQTCGAPSHIPKPLNLKQGPVMSGNRLDVQTKVVHVAHSARWIVKVFPENCSTSPLLFPKVP